MEVQCSVSFTDTGMQWNAVVGFLRDDAERGKTRAIILTKFCPLHRRAHHHMDTLHFGRAKRLQSFCTTFLHHQISRNCQESSEAARRTIFLAYATLNFGCEYRLRANSLSPAVSPVCCLTASFSRRTVIGFLCSRLERLFNY